MRLALHNVSMDGVVVIGEGEKDEAPMLYNGEQIGDGSPPQVDIAVDPLEGTELTAMGFPNALAVIALSERGTMFNPGPAVYMEKMATSPSLAHLLDMDRPLGETVKAIAKERSCDVGDVIVIMLDRPRHEEQVKEIREAGRAHPLHPRTATSSASLLAVQEGSPVDLLWGIGGTPEGVISACAIKCLGGQILGRLWPRNDEEKQAIVDAGLDARRRCSTATTSSAARTSSSPPPASPTATCSRASATCRAGRRRPSRSRCARAPGRCAASTRATTARSSARSPASALG